MLSDILKYVVLYLVEYISSCSVRQNHVLCAHVPINSKSTGLFVTVSFSLIVHKILGQITKYVVCKVTTSEVISKKS